MSGSAWTCVCCGVSFISPDAQRAHHSSEWHRYNLVRRISSLPPATLEQFEARCAANARPVVEKTSYACKPCKKTFTGENSYNNHLNSKKHKLAQQSYDEQADRTSESVAEAETKEEPKRPKDEVQEDDDDSDWSSFEEINDIFATDCLFCNHHSRTVTKNVAHMAVAHSFFIPDAEYCIDLKGFLEYLGEKISQGFMCLWCNERGRIFQSIEAAQAHMKDKGHCKVLHEGAVLAEYADFYDYSSSYPDHVEGDEDMEVDDENAIEIDSTESGEEYQLVLPSGATIGHRSLLRYYKQNLTSYSGAVVRKNDDKLRRVIFQYRSLGWAPQQSDAIAKKAKDIKYMKRAQMKWNMKLGVKANKLQHHFRVQCNY